MSTPRPDSRADHAPDPHIVYRRFVAPAVSPGGSGDRLEDGPVLLVGQSGVHLFQLADPGGEPSADAPGVTLHRFARLHEFVFAADADADVTIHQIAVYQGEPVYAVGVRASGSVPPLRDAVAPGELLEVGYRELYGSVGDDDLSLVGRAIQMVDWDESTRFCPRCGAPTDADEAECVKRCPDCELTQYPRLAPAMIVGVVRGDRLLLGQSPRFRGRFHSILAGFLEPGETAEECVRREVYEEVGISVSNIRYFASQPWPFPHSLMLGFTAEYESGELDPDPREIIHADWYAADELPNVPGEVSISGRIINWFRRTYG